MTLLQQLKNVDIFVVDPPYVKRDKYKTKNVFGGLLTILVPLCAIAFFLGLWFYNNSKSDIVTVDLINTNTLSHPLSLTVDWDPRYIDVSTLTPISLVTNANKNSECWQNRNKSYSSFGLDVCNFGTDLRGEQNGVGFVFKIKAENNIKKILPIENNEVILYHEKNIVAYVLSVTKKSLCLFNLNSSSISQSQCWDVKVIIKKSQQKNNDESYYSGSMNLNFYYSKDNSNSKFLFSFYDNIDTFLTIVDHKLVKTVNVIQLKKQNREFDHFTLNDLVYTSSFISEEIFFSWVNKSHVCFTNTSNSVPTYIPFQSYSPVNIYRYNLYGNLYFDFPEYPTNVKLITFTYKTINSKLIQTTKDFNITLTYSPFDYYFWYTLSLDSIIFIETNAKYSSSYIPMCKSCFIEFFIINTESKNGVDASNNFNNQTKIGSFNKTLNYFTWPKLGLYKSTFMVMFLNLEMTEEEDVIAVYDYKRDLYMEIPNVFNMKRFVINNIYNVEITDKNTTIVSFSTTFYPSEQDNFENTVNMGGIVECSAIDCWPLYSNSFSINKPENLDSSTVVGTLKFANNALPITLGNVLGQKANDGDYNVNVLSLSLSKESSTQKSDVFSISQINQKNLYSIKYSSEPTLNISSVAFQNYYVIDNTNSGHDKKFSCIPRPYTNKMFLLDQTVMSNIITCSPSSLSYIPLIFDNMVNVYAPIIKKSDFIRIDGTNLTGVLLVNLAPWFTNTSASSTKSSLASILANVASVFTTSMTLFMFVKRKSFEYHNNDYNHNVKTPNDEAQKQTSTTTSTTTTFRV